jgi:hypothetical protein
MPELEIVSSSNGSETTLPGTDSTDLEAVRNNQSSYRFRRLASKTIVSFGPDDPENPHNWSKVCNHVLSFVLERKITSG